MIELKKIFFRKNKNKEKKKEERIKLLLEDLASLESYIHDLITFTPLPIAFVSPLGVILEANPAFEEISGYSTFRLPGKQIETLFGKEKAEEIINQTIEKGKISSREFFFYPKEKTKRIVLVFTKTRKDEKGEIVGFFLSIFEITEQKKIEKELRDTQVALLNILEDVEEERKKAETEKNKTLAIISNLADGLLVLNEQNQIIIINPKTEEYLKIKKEEVIEKNISSLTSLERIKKLLEVIKNKKDKKIISVFRKELPIKEDFVLEVSTIPFKIDKEIIGTIIILHDVSREKIVEKLKTEFVSISAHQLRTPLSAIKWTLRMLLDGDLGEITEEQREYLQKTFISNERMIELVNSLLNVTRIEEGRFIYKPIKSQLEEILNKSIEPAKELAQKKKINFIVNLPKSKLPPVLVDSEKIGLAIQNLVDNAVKYTPENGKVIVTLKKVDNKFSFL